VADEPDLVRTLRELGGVTAAEGELRVHRGGVDVGVTCSGGSSTWVELAAVYPVAGGAGAGSPYRDGARAPLRAPRPMRIALRPETGEDRKAKMKGISRELQTLDAKFDEQVYVDSESEDDVILAVLSEPVRNAVRALLAEDFGEIVVDDEQGHVTATLRRFSVEETPERAERILAAFTGLVREMPAVETGAKRRSHPEETFLSVLVGLLILSGVASVAVGGLLVTTHHVGALLLGLTIGAVCGVVAGFTVPWFRGRSGSYERRQVMGGLLMMLGPIAGVLVAGWLAWR
jgi:hypothetical protein